MHGGKSAPRDTICASEGPINGFGLLVCVTVTLPRNVSVSGRNNKEVLSSTFWSSFLRILSLRYLKVDVNISVVVAYWLLLSFQLA